jgi:hypothetical protein
VRNRTGDESPDLVGGRRGRSEEAEGIDRLPPIEQPGAQMRETDTWKHSASVGMQRPLVNKNTTRDKPSTARVLTA